MNKNMNSPSKLTEFAPLSPEESQPGVASLFSKFFNFTKGKIFCLLYLLYYFFYILYFTFLNVKYYIF